jgi:DNA polymerase I-like protein with 3'-5' exonuclease and polymerase domains
MLGNRDYGIALGLLSDYEAMNKLPRHVAKIMSLCIVYGIDPWELMESVGIHLDDSDEALSTRESRTDLSRIA